jgi:bacteriorhodopsin
MLDVFYGSFYITYVIMLTTSLVTFIEAMRTTKPYVRHVLNLETAISLIAGYFYSMFIEMVQTVYKTSAELDWKLITKYRYLDWSITTPIMLLALCIVLSTNKGSMIHIGQYALIVLLNYAMIVSGYVGETNLLPKWLATSIGYVAFIVMFGFIYKWFVQAKPGSKHYMDNHVLYGLYLFIWTLYGVVYQFEESWKNIATNYLDLTAKCLIGLGLWAYYTKILVK